MNRRRARRVEALVVLRRTDWVNLYGAPEGGEA